MNWVQIRNEVRIRNDYSWVSHCSIFRSESSSITRKGNWLIDYPKSFKTTHSWKSCKMTCKTVSFSEMPLDMERYFQIFSNIIQYCQILPDIAWYFTILSNIVLWCKYCFNLSDILKNVNKCSIFGILTSQYCWILSFIVRRCVRYLPIFCLKVFQVYLMRKVHNVL